MVNVTGIRLRLPGSPGCGTRYGAAKFLLFGLIWLLFLCHGVLGFAHQVSCGTCEAPGSPDAPVLHGHAGHTTEAPGVGHGESGANHGSFAANYAAVVLLVFGALLFASLIGFRRGGGAFLLVSKAFPRKPLPRLRLSRRTSLPSLQVFRL